MRSLELGNVCSLITDGTHYTPPNIGEGFPFLTVKDIDDQGSLDFDGCSKISEVEFAKAAAGNSAPMVGDVLFSKDGTVGKVSIVRERRKFAVLSSIAILRPNLEIIEPEYLGHALKAPISIEQALKKKTGSAIRRIILSDLKSVRLSVPSLLEQRRIVAILDKADMLRAKRRAALANLDQLLHSLFFDMFGDPVTNDRAWRDDVKLGDVADIASGITKGRRTLQSVRSVPYLAVANVQDRHLKLDSIKRIEATEGEIERYRLLVNDLVLTEGGDPDKLGRGALWGGSVPECIHQNHVFRVRVTSKNVDPIFLNWLIGSSRGKRYFLSVAKQTTGIASINMSQLKSFPLLIPPIDLQARFSAMVSTFEKWRFQFGESAKTLDHLFESLQQRAFAGKL